LSCNQLTSIPDSISNIGNLIELGLSNNRLNKLPDSIGDIQGLTYLYLGHNKLTILPETIGNLINLREIAIYDNQLHEIPDSIGNLINVGGTLDLSENNLIILPESIGNLIEISELFIDNNELTAIPKSIGNMTNLVELYVEGNQIESLPKSIANLSSLAHIDLTNNPLDNDLSILRSLPQLETVVFLGVELSDSRYWTKLSEWKPEWLLDEENAEIRRLLIWTCGYESICQELNAIELDTWREYTLLKIDAEVDVEPMVLLKMTCPSTAHIHILRVPPEMTSAESAITWVNHDIHPDEFAEQT
jgi:leucine-rich repeat protein SHOC2